MDRPLQLLAILLLLIGMEANGYGQGTTGQAPTWVAVLKDGGVSWDRTKLTWLVDISQYAMVRPDPNPYTVVLESRKQGESEWVELGNLPKSSGDYTNQTPAPDPPVILLPERILAPPPQTNSTNGTVAINVGGNLNIIGASYTHHRLEPDTVYEYRMKAVNAHGEAPYSEVLAMRTAPLPPPSAPHGSFVRNLPDGRLEVLWTRSRYAREYLVERRHSSSDWEEVAALGGTEHSWIDDVNQPGEAVEYRVLARNGSGTSAPGPVFSAAAHRIRQVLREPADDELSALWRERNGVFLAAGPDDPERNALWFDGAGPRSLTTHPLVFLIGGFLEFDFWTQDSFNANGLILVQASLDGNGWTTLAQVNPAKDRGRWRTVSIELPGTWSSPGLVFRFLQTDHAGEGLETWALRDVRILAIEGEEPVPPSIRIHTPLAETIRHARRSIRFAGTASDNYGLLSWGWSLNDGPWHSTRFRPGKSASWNGTITGLGKGRNVVKVRAFDSSGNLSAERVKVVRVR